MSNDVVKAAALKSLLEDPEVLKAVLAQVETSEKQADMLGYAFKSLEDMNADELLEYAIGQKEAELAGEQTKAGKTENDDDDEDDSPRQDTSQKMAGMVEKMAGMVEKMGGYMTKMEQLYGDRKKEVDTITAVQEAGDANSRRVKELEGRIALLEPLLLDAQKSLKDLQGDMPQGIKNGYRPSQSNGTVNSNTNPVIEKKVEKSAQRNEFTGFMDFVHGGPE